MSDKAEPALDETEAAHELEPSGELTGESVEESVAETLHDIDSIKQELEAATVKADEAHEQLLRTVADMENQKRRQAQELDKARKFALEGFVNELLQVWDSLELGVKASMDEGADIEKLREGNELTLKLLSDVMNKFGVEQIDPREQPFNPDQHQAMTMVPSADVEPNTVIDVFQKGYLLNGRLVRPAMVVVSQGE
jgi:molecular chaperone GrpE